MKLFTSMGPNPAVVNAYLAERGDLNIPTEVVDIVAGDNRRAPFLAINPAGTLPVLQLDDGRYLAESTVICEYLDDTFPTSGLMGKTLEERAETRMWIRRLDISVVQPGSMGWRYGDALEFCKPRMTCIPHAADELKGLATEGLRWLNGVMGSNRYLCGGRFSFADIFLFVFVETLDHGGQPIDPALPWLAGWRARMQETKAGQVVKMKAAA